jgi:hypothetical protein
MRGFFQLVMLLAVAPCLAMDFRPPNPAETLKAVGRTEGLPVTLRRALDPGNDFAPIAVPRPGDWLAEHPELGQTFDDFIRAKHNKPDTVRNKICLQPLGRFLEGRSPPLESLKAYAAAYFGMNVKILTPVAIKGSELTTRVNYTSGNRQILTRDVLMFLKKVPP